MVRFCSVVLALSLVVQGLMGAADDITTLKSRAERGNAEAQYELGLMYDTGDGVAEDNREAVKWYGLAAEQGDAEAQFELGWMYVNDEGVNER